MLLHVLLDADSCCAQLGSGGNLCIQHQLSHLGVFAVASVLSSTCAQPTLLLMADGCVISRHLSPFQPHRCHPQHLSPHRQPSVQHSHQRQQSSHPLFRPPNQPGTACLSSSPITTAHRHWHHSSQTQRGNPRRRGSLRVLSPHSYPAQPQCLW